MKKLSSLVLFTLLAILPMLSIAQNIDKENTYKLSGKARRGKLAHVKQENNGNYKLYYITNAKKRKTKIQIYTFDKDFNFMDKKDEEVLSDKMKTRFTWFKFIGELYSVDGITISYNPMVAMKLKKKKLLINTIGFS